MVDKKLVSFLHEEESKRSYVWNNAKMISPKDNNLYWVILINYGHNEEIATCNYNQALDCWEVIPGEEVLFWMPVEDFLPEKPNIDGVGLWKK